MTKQNVKSYINTVGNRLKKAFTVDAFGQEKELEFWALCAEYSSRDDTPEFSAIARWVDMLYEAPVHIVYRKENDKLLLLRRQVFSENFSSKIKFHSDSKEEQDQYEKDLIQQFEQRLQNLEQKKDWEEIFLEHGKSAHAIGSCEHIPLYDSSGQCWGVYLTGPYVESPEQMKPKLTIIGRLLSQWLIKLEKIEIGPQKNYEQKISRAFGDLGTGRLNTEGIADIFNNYFIHMFRADAGAIIVAEDSKNRILSSRGFTKEIHDAFKSTGRDSFFMQKNGSYKISKKGKSVLVDHGMNTNNVYSYDKACILISSTGDDVQHPDMQNFIAEKSAILLDLLDFESNNLNFSEKLMDTYYGFLRKQEMQTEKTKFHTPRMIALSEKFSSLFGLTGEESEIIKKSAKLHDIGYIGSHGIEKNKSFGSEINHPLIGALMLEKLPVHPDIIAAIKSHHEWINGKGEPNQLKGEEIPWSAKIISLLEFIVEFIESNIDNKDKSDSELQETLVKELMSRADRQFDLVIVPTAVQLVKSLGWHGCIKIGTDQS